MSVPPLLMPHIGQLLEKGRGSGARSSEGNMNVTLLGAIPNERRVVVRICSHGSARPPEPRGSAVFEQDSGDRQLIRVRRRLKIEGVVNRRDVLILADGGGQLDEPANAL